MVKGRFHYVAEDLVAFEHPEFIEAWIVRDFETLLERYAEFVRRYGK